MKGCRQWNYIYGWNFSAFSGNQSQDCKLSRSAFNPIALRMAKTPQSFGHSECNRVNPLSYWGFCSYCSSLIRVYNICSSTKISLWQSTNLHLYEMIVVNQMIFFFWWWQKTVKWWKTIRPVFFYFLVLGSADPNFWKSRIKIKLGSKSFIFILSADRLMPSTNKIKARTIFWG